MVSDTNLDIVQIFVSTGSFLSSFDGTGGGTQFLTPVAVTVNSNDSIIVSDATLQIVQIFDSTGLFQDSFDGTACGGGTRFIDPVAVAVDSNDRIMVSVSIPRTRYRGRV